MRPLVLVEAGGDHRGFAAAVALEGLLARVRPVVPREIPGGQEGLVALRARVGALAGGDPLLRPVECLLLVQEQEGERQTIPTPELPDQKQTIKDGAAWDGVGLVGWTTSTSTDPRCSEMAFATTL
ncbi:unnamed protein product [Caretta caretta]